MRNEYRTLQNFVRTSQNDSTIVDALNDLNEDILIRSIALSNAIELKKIQTGIDPISYAKRFENYIKTGE